MGRGGWDRADGGRCGVRWAGRLAGDGCLGKNERGARCGTGPSQRKEIEHEGSSSIAASASECIGHLLAFWHSGSAGNLLGGAVGNRAGHVASTAVGRASGHVVGGLPVLTGKLLHTAASTGCGEV